MKVLVSDKLSENGVEILKQAEGIEVTVKTGMSPEELKGVIGEYDALIIRSATKVNQEIIEVAANLKVVGRAGIGVDNVDLDAASKKGIIVMNTPEGNTVTTAEHAISLMLSMARSIPQAYESLRQGKWEKKFMGVELYNKTIGVIGLGRIGSIVANRARGLAMKVIAFDPYISAERAVDLGVELVEFDDLLKRSDFITIHVPKSNDTAYLIGEKEFTMMKKGVRLINCARGGIVDEKSLIQSIKDKHVAGAALDVFEIEPLPEDSPLRSMNEIVITPHLGASTDEAQVNVAKDIAEQIIDYLKNGQIRNSVNVPSISATMLSKIKPYLSLGEKMGKMLAQLTEGGIQEIAIKYSGDIVDTGVKSITIALLKGCLEVFAPGNVNMVNASIIARERGIKVVESSTAGGDDFTSLISVTIKTDKMEKRLDGTIFGKNDPKIVRIDDYLVEASPTDHMLLFSNKDTPGVIGLLGSILGEGDVNIAGMQLGRNHPRGDAVSIMNVDSVISDELLEKIRSQSNINYAKMIKL